MATGCRTGRSHAYSRALQFKKLEKYFYKIFRIAEALLQCFPGKFFDSVYFLRGNYKLIKVNFSFSLERKLASAHHNESTMPAK